MSDLDLQPPALPGEKQEKRGFLHKFFFKHEEKEAKQKQPETKENVDLEEIKRKLGLDETPPPPPRKEPVQSEFIPEKLDVPQETPRETPQMPKDLMEEESTPKPRSEPAQKIDISDWTSDAPLHKSEEESQWSSAQEEQGTDDSTWSSDPTGLEGGEHHDHIDRHLAPVDTKHEKVVERIEKTKELPEIPDWHLHDKEVPQEHYFILKNGHKVKSLKDLIEAIDWIDDSTFEHHMNEHRNDFANWVHTIIDKPQLAEEIRKAESREQVADILDGHHEEAHAKFQSHKKEREKHLQSLETTEKHLEKARGELERRTEQLKSDKHAAANRLKKSMDKEISKRLSEKEKELERQAKELSQRESQIQKREQEIEAMQGKVSAREDKVQANEQRQRVEREELERDKKEAQQILKDAQQVKKDKKAAEEKEKQAKEHLKNLEERQIEITRHEETLKQREEKITKDLTTLHEKEEELEQKVLEFEHREAQVEELERKAAQAVQDAHMREQSALKAEQSSVAKVKEETAKLEALKSKIEDVLKKVIKNKDKAKYSKEIREVLERNILEAKDGIQKEKKDLEHEAYESYLETKISTTPAGQPDSDDSKDVERIKDTGLFKKLQDARSALEQNDLDQAKKLYNELRGDFQKIEVSEPEKNALYMSIRELYDDIHLAMLEH